MASGNKEYLTESHIMYSCVNSAFFQVYCLKFSFNPLDPRGNHSATSNNMKLVHWPLMGGLLHLVQREGPGRAGAAPSPLSLYQM